MSIETVTIVKILPTAVWIENDFCGGRSVMVQHEGFRPFEYAVFGYDYAYTSNSGTMKEAETMARRLGAGEVIEYRHRCLPPPLTADQSREQIAMLTAQLAAHEVAP